VLRIQGNTIAIVMAGGPGDRWADYTGVPKHLVDVNGEVLLRRTIGQLAAAGLARIIIVGPPTGDDRYEIPGAEIIRSQRRGPAAIYELFDLEKPWDSGIWNHGGRTLVVFGDVWFSTEAIGRISAGTQDEFVDGYRWYGRRRSGVETGFRNPEIFAIAFWASMQPRLHEAMAESLRLYHHKEITRCGGWEAYMLLRGLPLKPVAISGAFENIDDLTEDFDCASDFETWRKAYARLSGK
jgi:hypothetical protein